MAITYVNDLRLSEMATGDNSGTWGNVTNTNLELIGDAFGHGTRAIANASTDNITIADGTADADRAMYLKLTGGGQACTVTLLPNTVSKVWMMENGTNSALTFTQGSGANVIIPAGDTKIIASDGGGSGAIVYDVFASLSVVDLKVQDDLTVTDDVAIGGTLGVTGVVTANAGVVVDNITIDGNDISTTNSNGTLTLTPNGTGNVQANTDSFTIVAADGESATINLIADDADNAGDIWSFVNSTSNVLTINSDISGSDVAQATFTPNATVANSTTAFAGHVNVGHDFDVTGDAVIDGTALVTGVLTTTAATVFNGGFASNAASTQSKKLTISNPLADAEGFRVIQTTTARTSGGALAIIYDDQAGTDQITLNVINNGTGNTLQINDGAVISLAIADGGAATFTPAAGGHAVFNEGSVDADFRVESNGNTHAIFVDGGNDTVNIGGATNVNGAEVEFTLGSGASTGPYVAVRNNATSLTSDAFARLDIGTYTNNGSNYNASGSYTAKLIFQAQGNDNAYASGSIESYLVTAGNTARSNTTALLMFGCKDATSTSAVEYFRLNGAEQEMVINETSTSNDFRVESNGHTHALAVDGGNNCVQLGTTTTSNDTCARFGGSGSVFSFKMVNAYGGGTAIYAENTNNQGWIYSRFNTNNAQVGFISVGTSSTSYSTSGSDKRLKKNFETWGDSELSNFETLKPTKFNYNTEEDGTEKTKGFIAQDLVDAFPEAYPLDEQSDRYFFNPSGMVVYLMKAMQESSEKIKSLEARITALES